MSFREIAVIGFVALAAAMTSTTQATEPITLEVTPPQYITALKKQFPNLADEEHIYVTIGGGHCRGCSSVEFINGTMRQTCDFTLGPLVKLGEPPPIKIKDCRKAFLHDVW